MTESLIARVRLKAKEERRLLRGHLWAFRNELEEIPERKGARPRAPLEDGSVVDVFSDQGRLVGRGFYQAQGGIAVRILARKQAPIDVAFLAERINAAARFREQLFPGETAYRWVFGESDGLPGFVADRYGSMVSAQTSCGFYRSCLDSLAEAFLAHPGVDGIRIEVCGAVREYGSVTPLTACTIDGVQVQVNLMAGQKTGLFLDQRLNWIAARRYAQDARVLDGHCYVGLWSVHAALAGASRVTGVDTSAPALEAARTHADLNGVADRCTFECADVMDVLQRGDRYDLVILDPPALAKSRAHERKALGLYHELNAAAMRAVEPGGVLMTSSCSHFVDEAAFLEVLKRAALSVQRRAWVLEVRGAALDHPTLMAMPETRYLKCVVLRLL